MMMNKPWMGKEMGHKIYKVKERNIHDNLNQKIKKEEELNSKMEIGSSLRSMIVKTPFSIISEVSNFKRTPNINEKNKEKFVFRNQRDKGCRELEAKLLNTVHHYHEEVYCRLVSSNLHEKRVLLEYPTQQVRVTIEDDGIESALWIPIHSLELDKEKELYNYIIARLPVEIGKYKTEISIRETVVFKEKVIGIKEVSQDIVLTKNEILFPQKIKTGQNLAKVEKGSLLVEGYIFQCLEYIIEEGTSCENVYQLMQNIVLELIVQILQEQEIRVVIT
ncbi:TPA: BC_2427 family protein [Bacillus cereus]|uniref:BC_2427 family protein n=1 Tax=Bacillus cereus group TaxID=86661 RepID=UPI00103BC04E|nr:MULTISPECIES: hypothetical protein [Bacillus cereus group]KAA0751135.1 hypothetical protein DN397_12850 [Bacillus sp. AY1-10]MCU5555999.1 hypothetical protein [Bacillus cereus]MCU5691398.1 hypothetical protein [Bacillus cereus]TBX87905.1 hypothetical protein E0M29_20435 [Bacillus cereus]